MSLISRYPSVTFVPLEYCIMSILGLTALSYVREWARITRASLNYKTSAGAGTFR